MARIAIGGFQHETNTFASNRANVEDFLRPDAWPSLSRGDNLIDTFRGINIPIAGFIKQALADGHDLAPLLWCSASPSGPLTDDAFETITGMFLDDIKAIGPVDALYLDLHGAMVSESFDDGETELLNRIRRQVGPDLPIVISLDLHANISQAMVNLVSALVCYRTYPHVDMADTGARAARMTGRLLGHSGPVARHFRQLPFLIPLPWQSSLADPTRAIYRYLRDLEKEQADTILALSFAPGFPLADVADCGPSIIGYGMDQEIIDSAVNDLCRFIAEREADFAGRLYDPDDAVTTALSLNASTGETVIIADTQDNPGAGASSDTTGMLRALIRGNAQRAVIGLIYDPAAAAAAHASGTGAEIELNLGAGSAYGGERPFLARFLVEHLGDGNIEATGPFYKGSHMKLGPMALLKVIGKADVRVVVSSVRQQAADQAMFRHLNLEPAEQSILCLKSSVHFRADFDALTPHILVAAAPGPAIASPAALPYRKLRSGQRVQPQALTGRDKFDQTSTTRET